MWQNFLRKKGAYGECSLQCSVIVNGEEKVVDLISYEDMQFDWPKDYLLSGSLEKAQSENNTGLIVFDSQNNIEEAMSYLNLKGSQADWRLWCGITMSFTIAQGLEKLICSERYL